VEDQVVGVLHGLLAERDSRQAAQQRRQADLRLQVGQS
jgi:hypothetical protein